MAAENAGPSQAPVGRADRVYELPSYPEFRQGELLTEVSQFEYDYANGEIIETTHAVCILASQDCDLLWEFNNRETKLRDLNGLLLFEVQTAQQGRDRSAGGEVWKRTVQNESERYQALERVPTDADALGVGLTDMVVDFKRFFTVPPFDLARQVQDGMAKRRSVLLPPYREHFQHRVANYLARVGLPTPHQIEKVERTKSA